VPGGVASLGGQLVYLTQRATSAAGTREDDAVVNAESSAAEIVLDHVTKRYGNNPKPAIDDLSLTIPAGEICVLIGPSGGGKTTAMKMINRLISITEGDITIDGTSVKALETTELRRGIGYVIQQIGLFPHMTVENNVGTVPRLLGWDKQRIRARARELLELVGLDPDEHAKRFPSQLSGGQRQRVGLARAMAADPPLMLMDEPFGAIDPITRERLQNDFLRLHREIRKTVVFVTHDIDEAIKMGDRVCILREGGVLAQYDTPEVILAAPADDFVAQFVGADRGLKRLALRRLDEVDLLAVPNGGGDGAPQTSSKTTLRDALSLMLTEGSTGVIVVGEDGSPTGYMTFDVVSRLLSESEGQQAT
jgi:osmoprotectant transport system ATP-binding protein